MDIEMFLSRLNPSKHAPNCTELCQAADMIDSPLAIRFNHVHPEGSTGKRGRRGSKSQHAGMFGSASASRALH